MTKLISLVIARKENTFQTCVDVLSLTGVDNAGAMLSKCQEKLSWIETHNKTKADVEYKVELVESDLLCYTVENASIVIMNYTLQFVPVVDRPDVLSKMIA